MGARLVPVFLGPKSGRTLGAVFSSRLSLYSSGFYTKVGPELKPQIAKTRRSGHGANMATEVAQPTEETITKKSRRRRMERHLSQIVDRGCYKDVGNQSSLCVELALCD